MAKRRVAMSLPLVAVIAPILILFIAAALPSIVFGNDFPPCPTSATKGTVHDPTRVPRQIAQLRDRRRGLDPESGQAITEILMYGAVIVVVVVAVGAALEALGVDVVNNIRSALGL